MYKFVKVGTDSLSNRMNASLLADTFQKPGLFTPSYIAWQYRDNPVGEIVGFNAIAGEQIAAHYVAQPLWANVMGVRKKGLLSLNTATHPEHRGKGLFTKLAEATYAEGADKGYAFVVGVANQNSVHGFVKHLGFQLLGQLESKVGMGSIEEIEPPAAPLQFERIWEETALTWRLSNPVAPYFQSGGIRRAFFARTHIPLIKAFLHSAPNTDLPVSLNRPLPISFLTLYIGKDRSIRFRPRLFFEIPPRYRPAPLYLIFKDLTGSNPKLDFEDIRFRLIDFDVY
jgi:GNAT superfamily N-acetyltransferase